MAYNTMSIVRDKDGNPISQYYNPSTDSYEPIEGVSGANKVVLYNEDGSENNKLDLNPILDNLSRLTGTVVDEEIRKSNELDRQDNEVFRSEQEVNRVDTELDRCTSEGQRQLHEGFRVDNESTRQSNESIRVSAENSRVSFIDEFKSDILADKFKGDIGLTGIGLDYDWNNTKLGIKTEDVTEYSYVDLIGPQGVQGIQGDQGNSGVSVDINGTYYFSVVDGDLLIHYPDGETAPNFEINESGELIYNV